jgi:hypothetical protein
VKQVIDQASVDVNQNERRLVELALQRVLWTLQRQLVEDSSVVFYV